MTKTIKLIGMMLVLATGFTQGAFAMSCGTHVISQGQGQYEVLKRCGEPDARQGRSWIYKRGSVDKEVRFDRDGRIIQIR